MRGCPVEVAKRVNELNTDHGALKTYYNRLLEEYESTKRYLAEKASETIKARNKASLLAKNFAKSMKLSRFSYQIGEVKGIKVDREECKAKYIVANPLPRFPPSKILENEKLSLFDVDLVDETAPCEDDPTCPAATPTTELANPSVQLGGIDVVISDPTA